MAKKKRKVRFPLTDEQYWWTSRARRHYERYGVHPIVRECGPKCRDPQCELTAQALRLVTRGLTYR